MRLVGADGSLQDWRPPSISRLTRLRGAHSRDKCIHTPRTPGDECDNHTSDLGTPQSDAKAVVYLLRQKQQPLSLIIRWGASRQSNVEKRRRTTYAMRSRLLKVAMNQELHLQDSHWSAIAILRAQPSAAYFTGSLVSSQPRSLEHGTSQRSQEQQKLQLEHNHRR